MIRNFIKIAFRNLVRYKLHSIINIGGLALGISVFTLIIIYIVSELNYDKYHENYDKIYQLSVFGEDVITAKTGYDMKENYPEVKHMVRIDRFYGGGNNAYLKQADSEKLIRSKDIIYADSDFFSMFTVKPIAGELSKALKDPYCIVLTKSTAIKLFGNLNNVVNKTVGFISEEGRVRGDFTISAIIEDVPVNSSIKYSAIASINTLNVIKPAGVKIDIDDYNWGYQTFIILQDNIDLNKFVNKAHSDFIEYASKRYDIDPESEEVNEITMNLIPLGKVPFYNNNKIQFIYLITLIGFIIIIIAIINFVNLSLAKSFLRSKEIGLRKVAGSSRGVLIRQFIGEAVVLVTISVMISLILSEILKPLFNRMVEKELTIGYIDKPQILLIFIAGTIVLGILAGFYPAIVMSKYNPIKSLKNEISIGGKGSILKQALSITQITVSLTLIIGVILIMKQIDFMKTKDIGFDSSNIIYFKTNHVINEKYDLFKGKLMQNPDIISVSRAGSEFGEPLHISDQEEFNGKKVTYKAIIADPDFIKTMGLEIVKGRNYEWDKASDIGTMIINETAAKEFGEDSIIGYKMSFLGETQYIIGIYKDVHNESFHEKIKPAALVNYNVMLHRVIIRIATHKKKESIKYVENVWKEIIPDVPFQYNFLEDKYDELYKTEEKFSLVIKLSALFSIMIACLGLFGMISFTSERRKKEIGIRKTNGASMLDILVLLNKGILKWIGIASIIACPIAYFAAKKWLQNFAYQTPIDLSVFMLAFIIILIVALLTVSIVVVRTAKTNPAECLRYE